MKRSVLGRGLTPVWVMAGLGLAGCSAKPPPKQEEPAVVRLRRVVQAYDIAEYKLGRPPRNEDELKRFFKETGATDDPEQLLTSPRDGQKYVILYGPRLDPYGKDILAHEKDGADGRRYVILLSRDVRLMSDEDFARTNAGQAQKAPRAK